MSFIKIKKGIKTLLFYFNEVMLFSHIVWLQAGIFVLTSLTDWLFYNTPYKSIKLAGGTSCEVTVINDCDKVNIITIQNVKNPT